MAAENRARASWRMRYAMALACAVLCCLTLLPIGLSGSARAQGATGTSYITPFPDNDSYRLEVWGDVLAEGLLVGLVD